MNLPSHVGIGITSTYFDSNFKHEYLNKIGMRHSIFLFIIGKISDNPPRIEFNEDIRIYVAKKRTVK